MDGTVIGIKPHPKNEAWRVVTVDGKDFIVFSGKAADALIVGSPLPDGTSQDPPKFEGALPSLKLPYKPGGGAPAAFRNTKEGFAVEQDSIHRSVALKLAVKQHEANGPMHEGYEDGVTMLFNFYLKLLRGEGQTDATAHQERTTDPIPASTSAPAGNHGEGATGAAVSEGGPGLTGGSRAGSPEGNPWEGMDV